MARKRKARAVETVQPVEPEPQLAEPEPEPEPEQAAAEEIPETLEEEQPGTDEEDEEIIEGEEVEEEVVEDEEQEPEGEEENPNDMKELKSDAVSEDNEREIEMTEKPSESADDLTTGGEHAEKQTEEKDEEDLEEEPLEKLLEPFTKDQLTLLIKEYVAKHPDIIESVHKLADADPAHRKIFVHGLGWEASSETITSVFGKYGEIEDCKVVKDKISGKSKGYGFILFKHRSGARRALKQPQKLIEGRMTSCQLASAGPVLAPPPTIVASVSGPPVSEYTQRKIYVSNVSAELDPNKLMEYFSQFGEIEEGPLGLDKQTGKPRGFCLFVYKSVESAKKALEEPHKNYEGQTLHCQKAVDGPKHSKGGGYFQQHGQQHQHHHQGYHHQPAKKGRYSGGGGSAGHTGGHLMAPSAGSAMPSMGFNPAVAPAAIGQAVAALLASQGASLGIGNLLGGIGAGANQQGVPPMMNNAGYGGQGGAGGYGVQPGLQGGYGGQQQMGQPGVRPHQGGAGAPYMGHGR